MRLLLCLTVTGVIRSRAGLPLTTQTPNFEGTALAMAGYAEGQQIICEPMYTACAICRMSESIKDS